MFGRLRDAAEKANPRVSLEFYLISCGIGETLRRTSIAKEFKEIWASDFHYDAQGRIMFPKKIRQLHRQDPLCLSGAEGHFRQGIHRQTL